MKLLVLFISFCVAWLNLTPTRPRPYNSFFDIFNSSYCESRHRSAGANICGVYGPGRAYRSNSEAFSGLRQVAKIVDGFNLFKLLSQLHNCFTSSRPSPLDAPVIRNTFLSMIFVDAYTYNTAITFPAFCITYSLSMLL